MRCTSRCREQRSRYARPQVEHGVESFGAWKQTFDSDPLGREQSGVRRYRIFRAADDPEYVLHGAEFDTADEAEALHERLKELWSRVDVMRNPNARVFEAVGGGEY